VVSHDRYFLERTTDDIYALLGDGAIRHLPNGVDEYLERRRGFVAAATGAATRASASASAGNASGARDLAQASGVGAVLSAADARLLRKELTKVERRSQRLHVEEDRLHAELAAAATDHATVLALDTELRAVVAEREELEDRWLEIAAALE
jgi:ATP-binding cassette subfamily F protein uup